MIIGYARVSTTDQDTALQLDSLNMAGCERVYQEAFSGASRERPELLRCLDALREGDTLTVWRLDRLADLSQQHHSQSARFVAAHHSTAPCMSW